MNDQIRQLIAVGASVGANCHPCLEYNVGKAMEMGIDRNEIMMAIDVAKAIRKGAASSMDKLALNLVHGKLPVTLSGTQECSCCS